MADDKKDAGQSTLTPKTGTLSVGKLSARPAAPASPASNATRGRTVAVEVRKRRDFNPATPVSSVTNSAGLTDKELENRLRVLQEAQKNADLEAKRRDEDRRVSEELTRSRQQEEHERRRREDELRRAAEQSAQAQSQPAAPQTAAKPAAPVATAPRTDARPATTAAAGAPTAPVRRREDGRDDRNARPAAARTDKDPLAKRGGRNAYLEDLESIYRGGGSRKKLHRGHMMQAKPAEKVRREVVIPEVITVADLAARMSERGGDVVKKLMLMGQMVTLNQTIDRDTAAIIVGEFGHTYKFVSEGDIEENLMEAEDNAGDLVERPPVVTVMGHVDHGKTSLLDAIRSTDVAAGEAGGITQHIGAYQVTTKSGRKLTFLDTPGHEAFTAMRARGAAVTDVVILVVAADDGVMPQTIEAIKHAKAAEVPIVVAVNKIDKAEARPERVKQELLNHGLVAEEFGGDTIFVDVSAKKRMNLDKLEEMVLLQSEVLDLKANPNRRSDGVVVESQLDKGRGSVATVIVQRGTLRVGDIVVAGSTWGRVRALVNDHGERVEEAGPAMPVEILGLQGVPVAGDTFAVLESERRAREVAEYREKKKRDMAQAARSGKVTLENLFSRVTSGEVKELGVVVKGDVQGSVEAIVDALSKLATDEVKVRVLHSAVGVITESDVMLAAASNALIIGFSVRANAQARDLAEREGIELRYYSIIYNLIDDVKAAMAGMLAPTFKENVLGHASIRDVIRVSKVGNIAGCMVIDGLIRRNAKVRLLRDGVVIHEGSLASLKRFKDDAREVANGFECGLSVDRYDDIRVGDVVECYEMEQVQAVLGETQGEKDKKAAAKQPNA